MCLKIKNYYLKIFIKIYMNKKYIKYCLKIQTKHSLNFSIIQIFFYSTREVELKRGVVLITEWVKGDK